MNNWWIVINVIVNKHYTSLPHIKAHLPHTLLVLFYQVTTVVFALLNDTAQIEKEKEKNIIICT